MRPVYVYVSWNAMRFKVLKFDYMMTDESKYGHNHAGRRPVGVVGSSAAVDDVR